jgi:hypothetical protein
VGREPPQGEVRRPPTVGVNRSLPPARQTRCASTGRIIYQRCLRA